jgi:hypothetical protein
LSDDAPADLSEQIGARRGEALQQLDVARGWGGGNGQMGRVCGHNRSKVTKSYSQAPHKFARQILCLRNFSQADMLPAFND